MPTRPRLSWNPIRFVTSFVTEGRPAIEEWLALAGRLGLPCVEIYHGLLPSKELAAIRRVRRVLDGYGLCVSMYTCASDFAHPDPAERERQLAHMVEEVERARILGAPVVRVTAGCRHDGVPREEALRWAAEGLTRLAEQTASSCVQLGLENHYQDRLWTAPDVVFHTEAFLELFDMLRETPVGVNFDCSNQLMTGDDPLRVLEVVKHRVCHVHASDRQPGQYAHSVIGEGSVAFDPLLSCLAEISYAGCISLEDGNPEGDEGTRRAIAFMQARIEEHWG